MRKWVMFVIVMMSFAVYGQNPSPLTPTLLAKLRLYFLGIDTPDSISRIMLKDGIVNLQKTDIEDFKSVFATGTPLYVFIESDPFYIADKPTIKFAGDDGVSIWLSDYNNDAGFVTDVSLTEVDPVFTAQKASGFRVVGPLSVNGPLSAGSEVIFSNIFGIVNCPSIELGGDTITNWSEIDVPLVEMPSLWGYDNDLAVKMQPCPWATNGGFWQLNSDGTMSMKSDLTGLSDTMWEVCGSEICLK